MKSILLASASVIAFAGAAAAEVSFGGSATLGYNDDINNGIYWEGDLSVSLSQELDNGLTAAASFGLNITADDLTGDTVTSEDFAISLTSESAGLHFGVVDTATQRLWSAPDGMAADVFAEEGDWGDAQLRGDITYGGVDASISYGVAAGELVGLQVAATATFGNFNLGAAYQDADSNAAAGAVSGTDSFGVSLGTSFSGADVTLAYVDNGDDTSIGIGASYPVGPVTVGAYYAVNDPSDDAWGLTADYASGPLTVSAFYDVVGTDGVFGVEGSYDVGNNITALFGVIDNGDAYYVAANVDMGGGASLLVSYAQDDNDPANDAIGDPEYLHGITAEVGLSF
ncbi:MAG: porin [Rhodobacterales bacterium]|nr:porin [Rhodobacterales bacterium]NCT11287.1 porin [Rhodobacterales bacterium]